MNNESANIPELLKRMNIQPGRRFVSITEAEGIFIHNFIRDSKLSKTLEIGLAHGVSAACILSAHDGIHTCIDPYQEKNFQNIGLKNLEALVGAERVAFYQDLSHNVLPKLHLDGKKYDFVFIDGDHRFNSVFVDFYYSDLLLEQGGYILFHDAWMRSVQLVASYIRRNHKGYKRIRGIGWNLILFQKTAESATKWDDFAEFYTFRGWFSATVIRSIVRLISSR